MTVTRIYGRGTRPESRGPKNSPTRLPGRPEAKCGARSPHPTRPGTRPRPTLEKTIELQINFQTTKKVFHWIIPVSKQFWLFLYNLLFNLLFRPSEKNFPDLNENLPLGVLFGVDHEFDIIFLIRQKIINFYDFS